MKEREEILRSRLEKLKGLKYLTDEALADDAALGQIIRQEISDDPSLDEIRIKIK